MPLRRMSAELEPIITPNCPGTTDQACCATQKIPSSQASFSFVPSLPWQVKNAHVSSEEKMGANRGVRVLARTFVTSQIEKLRSSSMNVAVPLAPGASGPTFCQAFSCFGGSRAAWGKSR